MKPENCDSRSARQDDLAKTSVVAPEVYLSKTPRIKRLMAEFEPHRCTYLLWPLRSDNWRDSAKIAQHQIRELAELIATAEPVVLGYDKSLMQPFESDGPITFFPIDYDDIWIRDTGPSVVNSENDEKYAIDWKFNSWGGLFSTYQKDDNVAKEIAGHEHFPIVRAPIVLEPGAISTDGNHTLIVSEESVINDNRNPGLSKARAEAIFSELLGITQTIWIPFGLYNDEAGGHIDNVCVFASERTIICAEVQNSSDLNASRLKLAKKILSNSTNTLNQSFEIVAMPLPRIPPISQSESSQFSPSSGMLDRKAGTLLAGSYVNAYIANGLVVVPQFDVPEDAVALSVFRRIFPDRRVIGFGSRDFLLGGGAIHCLTKDIPK